MGNKLTSIDKFKTWVLPVSVVVTLWILSGVAWIYHEQSENTKLHVESYVTAEQIKLRLEAWVNHRIEIVDKIASDWDKTQPLDKKSFTHKALELQSWTPGLQALNFIDENWVINVIVPYKGNEPALGKDLHHHPSISVQSAIAQAEETKKISRTEIIELLQGGKGFATYAPVMSESGEIVGYLNGVFKLDMLIESCFSEPLLTEKFAIEFYENNQSLLGESEFQSEAQLKFLKEFPVKIVDKNLQMKIVPTAKYLKTSAKYISYWIICFTLLFSLGMGYVFRLSILNNQIVRKSEEHFRTVVEYAGDAFFLVSKTGDIVDVNQQACTDLQYSKEELTSMNINKVDELINEEFVSEKLRLSKNNTITFETKHKTKNGTFLPVEIRSGIIEINNVNYFLCLSRDISESKKLQELEARAQRLETAGQVAGQVAHDFNNLLAPLVAYPDLIKGMLSDNHPAIKLILKIEKSAIQIAEINQQLLTLGRRGHYNLQTIDLNEIITQVLDEKTYNSQCCQITTNYEKALLPIHGGSSQIVRIISNLINNAFEAIEDDGIVNIKTENYYLDESTSDYFSIPVGEYVKLTIADNGIGIPEEVLPTIFEPFVSTKKADKKRGSGLGLSIVQSVVKDHHGHVDLKSEVGVGTEFYLYFPISRETIEVVESGEVVKGNEKILIVDDDKTILEVTQTILEMLGYNVQTVETGEDALEMLRNESFDLLILDMIIPNSIDGTETFRRALEINNNQKAIIVSGYAESTRVEEALRLGVKSFVKKPFTKEILSQKLHEALHEHTTKIYN